MPRDKSINTRKIMAAARKEFLEKGYEKASLRAIAKECGITAAAVYRHAENKEDLFFHVVSEAVERIQNWEREHLFLSEDSVKNREEKPWYESLADMMRYAVYPHMEEYHLLMTGAHGTAYENYLRDLTEDIEKKLFQDSLKQEGSGESCETGPLHPLLYAYMTALFEPAVQNCSEEEANESLALVKRFFETGWKETAQKQN